ncbi:MAG: protein phosphatase CheZ [Alphaproteobacteria bacterium]|nr:protein phosphatase CheZ [Alphaproteobacteria bacterium]
MATTAQPSEVASLLHDLRQKDSESIRVEDISAVVEGIMQTLRNGLSDADRKVFVALESLSTFIAETKRDIAALRPDEVKDELIPTASDELDAIVAATAEATHSIMDSAEAIESVAASVDKKAAAILTDEATRIFEACGFQDITGQRITKVVNALKDIDKRVDSLINAFGDEIAAVKAEEQAKLEKSDTAGVDISDEALLEGPQMEGAGTSQDDIDKMFD